MKTTFFGIFDPTWTNILTSKGPDKEFVEKGRNWIINFVPLGLTNQSEILENNQFFVILNNLGNNLVLNLAFLAIFALNFHSGVYTTTTSCFKVYSPYKMWEKPIDDASFTFFLIIGPNLVQLLPQYQTHFDLFCWFPMKYVRGFN